MGREPKSYRVLTYELWDASVGRTTHPQVNFGKMIAAYEVEAANYLAELLAYMRRTWPIKAPWRGPQARPQLRAYHV